MIKKYLAGRKERIEAGEYGSIIAGNIMQKKYEIKSKKINKRMKQLRETTKFNEANKIVMQKNLRISNEDVSESINEVNELIYALQEVYGRLENITFNENDKKVLMIELLKKYDVENELECLHESIGFLENFMEVE